MDFFRISIKEVKGESLPSMYPDFIVGRSNDLMVRGQAFYAIWDEEAGLWSTDEYDVQRLVDAELVKYEKHLLERTGEQYSVKYMRNFANNVWTQFRKFLRNVSDNNQTLDPKLTFANSDVKKGDFASRRLPYPLEAGDHSAWDELVGTLFPVEERAKIEWAIGAIVSGDSKKLEKFLVFYGPPGSGKGTILQIVYKMFSGYATTFDAKALGSSNAQFATEVFKSNPLVAIQFDGDLSKIEDNARLNTIVSHEDMPMNEKYKPGYTDRIYAFLMMGTNKPVKISDAMSGILRRLIDVHPSGVRIPKQHYDALVSRTQFEYGAIAQHCLDTYRQMGKNYYETYRPLEMQLRTDIFFNFIEAYYDVFKSQDGISLRQAYILYKEFCNDTNIEHVMPQIRFRSELQNYFENYKDRGKVDGQEVRSYYSGFNANKFKQPSKTDISFSLVIEETESLLDERYSTKPAQLSTEVGTPRKRWVNVTTTLADIDTKEEHFVKVPENDVVIDFDLKDDSGEKSLERNLEAASAWPATYAELSTSGNGVHLHYERAGDLINAELAPVFSEGIEVKVYRGDSSLRRRLSRCNGVPVSSISTGLPLKEKKLIEVKRMMSEKGVRDLIARSMNKDFHGHTKPEIDFIKKILDDATRDGVTYDVSDLRPKVMAFANNSGNQRMECIKTVLKMKWASEDRASDKFEEAQSPSAKVEKDLLMAQGNPLVKKDERLVFFDVEVYPNLFVICWKWAGDATVIRMINPTPQECEKLLSLKLVGFYNRRYDNHILYGRIMGMDNQQLFELSQKIIVDRNNGAMFGEAYGISYADIWDFSSIKQSLKLFQIKLGLIHKEIDIPWDQPVPEERWGEVTDYCVNDVVTTEEVFNDRIQDFVARQILADLSGLQVNDTTQRHTARIIFGNDRKPQDSFVYTELAKEFEGYHFDRGVSTYRGEEVGEGGLVRAKPGMYFDVALYDVASMHPTSIVQLNLFGKYTPNFASLLSARLAIKNKDYDTAREMLGGKLAPYLKSKADADALAYALKIVINIVYGLTSAKFENPFRDLRYNLDNIVAKRGALFMMDLKVHAEEEMGLNVVHIKTDSIKVPDATSEDFEAIHAYGKKWGYDFEHEATYDRFCLVNDAVYIARYGYHHSKPELVGTWVAVGAQFQHAYVYKMLFTGEPLTFDDFCETKQVTKGAMYLSYPDSPMIYVGRTGRFVPVLEGGAKLLRMVDDKGYAVNGTKDHLWVEATVAKSRGNDLKIDMSYFEKLAGDAVKTIEKFGDFEKFVGQQAP